MKRRSKAFIIPLPSRDWLAIYPNGYLTVIFDGNGKWKSMAPHSDKQIARKALTKIQRTLRK